MCCECVSQVGELRSGDVVSAVAVEGDWLKIILQGDGGGGGGEAWVPSRSLFLDNRSLLPI